MRIAILTQPLRYNFGGILQNYALQTVLRRMGHEVVTLDPARYICKWWWQYLIFIFRHIITRYIRRNRDVTVLSEWLHDKEMKTLGTNTFKFIDNYIQRNEYRNLRQEIKGSDYDAYIVGSDQTWRYRYNRWRLLDMFLDFTKGWNVKRIAYAASFGTDEWEGDAETTNICREAIKDFNLVTVRESSGINICKDVFNVDAQHVLDPTLLLNKEDYMHLVNRMKHLDTKDGELYLYILDENEENKKLANDIASSKGMKSFTYHSNLTNWQQLHTSEEQMQSPVELWISGFDQAKVVLTDSFHACVFSIIFRKQFYLYGNTYRGMARYNSLFNMLGINNRMVKTIEDIKNIQDINYNIVYDKLRSLQQKSTDLLNSSLI